jgi:hypothetical protein
MVVINYVELYLVTFKELMTEFWFLNIHLSLPIDGRDFTLMPAL